jgi:hypothetical protein
MALPRFVEIDGRRYLWRDLVALREQRPEAWRAAHRRLYEHLLRDNEGQSPAQLPTF